MFVYCKYFDYIVFVGLCEMKVLIDVEVVCKDLVDNFKFGFGGICEIEFIV